MLFEVVRFLVTVMCLWFCLYAVATERPYNASVAHRIYLAGAWTGAFLNALSLIKTVFEVHP